MLFFFFAKDVFWSERVSLIHHCSFTTRAMGAAGLGPSKLRGVDIIRTQLLIVQEWEGGG